MKKLLVLTTVLAASTALTGCFSSSAAAPTNMEEFFALLTDENFDNVSVTATQYNPGYANSTIEAKADGTNYWVKSEAEGMELYASIKGTTATIYMEVEEGVWLYQSQELEEDDMDMDGELEEFGVTAEDFVQQEDGSWVYSYDEDYYSYSTRTTATVTFTDGEVFVVVTEATVTTTTTEGVETETVGTATKLFDLKMFDFGSTKVTLPDATSYDDFA